ncbi:hypothetical protein DFQ28_007872 [Apophysomyces sp. BC1034]|nr:hypothetical protein DFQ28_007872 [Apophysomyces sp. BC1034]
MRIRPTESISLARHGRFATAQGRIGCRSGSVCRKIADLPEHVCMMPNTASQAPGGADVPMPDNYETALGELESLVERMEGGALSLEASLAAYRRGAALVAYCQQQLEKVEQQVRVLDGETLKPIDSATDDGECA